MSAPKTVYDIRRENLRRLLEEPGAKTQMALRLGVNQTRISHLVHGQRPIHEDTAREIEKVIGWSPRALDRDPAAPQDPADVDKDVMTEVAWLVGAFLQGAGRGKPLDKALASRMVKVALAQVRLTGKVEEASIYPLLQELL